MIYGLYEESKPDEIRYVGQTVNNPNRRLNQHRYEARGDFAYLPVHRWMKKHGPEKIHMTILEEGTPQSELDEREGFWISEYQTYQGVNPRGLNLTSDGTGQVLEPNVFKLKMQAMRVSREEQSRERLTKNRPGATPEEVVSEIRTRYAQDPDLTVGDLADELGIDRHKTSKIIRNVLYEDPSYSPPEVLSRGTYERRRARNAGAREQGGLNWEKASEIRELWLQGDCTTFELGEKFDVDHTTVWHVISNRTWRDPDYENTRGRSVPDSVAKRIGDSLRGRPKPEGFGKKGEDNVSSKLTESQVRTIIARLHAGERGRDLSREYGISETTVSCIKRGKTWTEVPRPWMESK